MAARHGAQDVRVFGSVARGEAGPCRDLDLLMTMNRVEASWICAPWGDELEDLLGRKVDVLTLSRRYQPHLREAFFANAFERRAASPRHQRSHR